MKNLQEVFSFSKSLFESKFKMKTNKGKVRNFQSPLSRIWRALLHLFPCKPAQLLSLKFQKPHK
ncbi:MAG: hypothetical protein DSZ30_04190 [Aquificaceae bacterium]|nr:MAG: hypothetical protein DSZ30_04190 [Aquificaceae bacterium]